MWPCWSRCGFFGWSMSLGVDFGVSEAQARSFSCLVILIQNSELPLHHHVCLHAIVDINRLNKPLNVSKPQLNTFFYGLPWLWQFFKVLKHWPYYTVIDSYLNFGCFHYYQRGPLYHVRTIILSPSLIPFPIPKSNFFLCQDFPFLDISYK